MPIGIKGFQKGHIINKGRIFGEEFRRKKLGNTYGFKKGQRPVNYVDGSGSKRRVPTKRGKEISHINWCIANNLYRVPFTKEKNGCVIHHINQNQNDNRPENLILMTKDFHNKLHNEYFKLRNRGEI